MELLFASQAKLGYMQRQNYIINWLKFINHYLNELKNANNQIGLRVFYGNKWYFSEINMYEYKERCGNLLNVTSVLLVTCAITKVIYKDKYKED